MRLSPFELPYFESNLFVSSAHSASPQAYVYLEDRREKKSKPATSSFLSFPGPPPDLTLHHDAKKVNSLPIPSVQAAGRRRRRSSLGRVGAEQKPRLKNGEISSSLQTFFAPSPSPFSRLFDDPGPSSLLPSSPKGDTKYVVPQKGKREKKASSRRFPPFPVAAHRGRRRRFF